MSCLIYILKSIFMQLLIDLSTLHNLLIFCYDSPYLLYTLLVYGSSVGNVLVLNNILTLLFLLPSLSAVYYYSPLLQMRVQKPLTFYSLTSLPLPIFWQIYCCFQIKNGNIYLLSGNPSESYMHCPKSENNFALL